MSFINHALSNVLENKLSKMDLNVDQATVQRMIDAELKLEIAKLETAAQLVAMVPVTLNAIGAFVTSFVESKMGVKAKAHKAPKTEEAPKAAEAKTEAPKGF